MNESTGAPFWRVFDRSVKIQQRYNFQFLSLGSDKRKKMNEIHLNELNQKLSTRTST